MILDVLRPLIAEQFMVEPGTIAPDTHFYEDLGADSLDGVELAMACEEEFGVVIEDNDASWAIETVGDLIAYIEAQMDAQ